MSLDLDFPAPGPGSWFLDTSHLTTTCSGYSQELFATHFDRGFRACLRSYGSLLEAMPWAWVNGFPYYGLAFVGAPPEGDHPPREVWDEVMATDPEIRERLANAERAFETRVWRDELARWDAVDRPQAVARHRELLAVDPDGLDDAGMLEYLAACTDNVAKAVFLHHVYNMAAFIPPGDLVAHVVDWTGLSDSEALGLLQGCSPDALGGEAALTRLSAAVRTDRDARAALGGSDPARALADLLALSGEAGEAARAYVELVAYRPVNGEDVGDTCAFELPELLVGAVRSAVEDGIPVHGDDQGVAERTAAIRAQVPAESRERFDEVLAEARHTYRIREERAVFGDQWSYGVARRALNAAGSRLVGRGRLDAETHLVEATWDEIQAIWRGDAGAPDREELAARAAYRQSARFADAPAMLGPAPGAPLPLDWLPPASRRMERALLASVGALFGPPREAGEGDVVHGLPVSAGVIEGPARVVDSSAQFGRIRKGDVLVTRATTAAFNIVLPLVSAIVTDNGGMLCHGAIVSREYGIPGVVGCNDATIRIPDGARVRVDGGKGEVTILR